MPLPQDPFRSRSLAYTSIPSPVKFSPPIGWIYVVNAGNVVVKDEAGNATTFASCSAGEVLSGPFSEITSMTSSSIRAGDGPLPQSEIAGVETSSAASLTTRISTSEAAVSSGDTSVATAFASADTSLYSRLSTADASVTTAFASADTSLYTRLSTVDATLTSQTTSLTTRISIAESVEASVH